MFYSNGIIRGVFAAVVMSAALSQSPVYVPNTTGAIVLSVTAPGGCLNAVELIVVDVYGT